jgi:hypothetical protein
LPCFVTFKSIASKAVQEGKLPYPAFRRSIVGMRHAEPANRKSQDIETQRNPIARDPLPAVPSKIVETFIGADRSSENRKRHRQHRLLWSEMEEYASELIEYLNQLSQVNRIAIAGSFWRKRGTVGDLDILITCKDSTDVMDHLERFIR